MLKGQSNILTTTESVCPDCLRRIPAFRVAYDDRIYLEKTCPEHGFFRVLIWQGKPAYSSWSRPKIPSQPVNCATTVKEGCPFDCGLCPEHRQHSCCVLLEVTQRCNLNCPVCFAATGDSSDPDPGLEKIKDWYQMLMNSGGPFNIQLSGGEPTLRHDLPKIVALGKSMGFTFIQVNTNGLRLADDAQYVRQLNQEGLDCVFLQFDGTEDAIYTKLRGRPMLSDKIRAIARCREFDLGVILVPTLVPGVNFDDIGSILRFAIENMPVVRGVHFQPISYFGRYDRISVEAERITIPAVLQAIEHQTGGLMKVANFHPPGGENAYCSFNGNFLLMPDNSLKPLAAEGSDRCCTPRVAAEGAKQAREFVAGQWRAPDKRGTTVGCNTGVQTTPSENISSLDDFLERVNTYKLAVSGMTFQDAWNLDLERLKECFIHVVSPDSRIIPFCAYNLTGKKGQTLYRG